MKTRLTQLFALLMLLLSFSLNAQLPARVGSWTFDDAADMLKADVGAALELNGTQVSIPGPVDGNLATQIGPGSNLKLTHGIAPNGGGTMVNEYTIMMDIALPALGVWHAFYQTEVANTGDADLFCRAVESTLGVGATGYGTKPLSANIWYRMVISVKNGTSFNVYLNTELFLKGTVQTVDGRFALADAFLLFADNSGDDNLINCAEVAVWDVAFDQAQVTELGLAPGTVLVSDITVSGAGDATTIDTDNGTLQMSAAILPVDATNQEVAWSVESGTGSASISSTGLLTAKEDGTVTVTAKAKDISGVVGTKEITISNQVLTMDDFNVIKDGGFATDGPIASPWVFWTDNGGAASVTGGVCVMVPVASTANWHLQVNQTGNTAGWQVYNDTSYVFMFDAKADAPRIFSIDFEDPNNGYKRFGLSSNADSPNGESQWDVSLTTDMTTYVRDVTFNAVKANTKFLLNILPSISGEPVSIDNIYLIKASDIHKFGTMVSGISVKGEADASTIETDKGTLQMMTDILPLDATLPGVFWTVTDGTGKATISSKGLLTAVYDGTVTVTATAKDGSGIMGTMEVTISNQLASVKENANLIKDGHFDTDGTVIPVNTLAPLWVGYSGNNGVVSVIDGVCTMVPSVASDGWQLQLQQIGNDNDWILENGTTYVVMFDAWADSARICSVDFEDKSPGYTRFGTSKEVDANNGLSDWTFNLSKTKTTFARVFTCTNVVDGSVYKFLVSAGAAAKTVYIDNVYLFKMSDVPAFGAIPVSTVTVTGAGDQTTITTDLGTLQMSAAVLPADATIKNIGWSVVDGTGSATIDAKGLLTAGTNGTVTVKATALDWMGVEGSLEITISGQTVGVAAKSATSVKIYPNPVGDELNIMLAAPGAKIAIYNSLGSKIHEQMVNEANVKIDVSNYTHGLYFIKVNNDTILKFIK
ncbi:MAG: Ig-like domain-containing protein [Bacteroidales bacterium]|nr:Ig-like domain-containing protein [Bacteroidales bacterium]